MNVLSLLKPFSLFSTIQKPPFTYTGSGPIWWSSFAKAAMLSPKGRTPYLVIFKGNYVFVVLWLKSPDAYNSSGTWCNLDDTRHIYDKIMLFDGFVPYQITLFRQLNFSEKWFYKMNTIPIHSLETFSLKRSWPDGPELIIWKIFETFFSKKNWPVIEMIKMYQHWINLFTTICFTTRHKFYNTQPTE